MHKQTAEMLSEVWDKAKIPTVTSYRIIDKITRLHKEYYGLRKSATRTMGKAVEDRNVFTRKLDNLLDVSHPEEERLVKNEEDHDFLVAQNDPGVRDTCLA